MSCCSDPRPRILESNGRVFCDSCRAYLDAPPDTSEPPSEASDTEPGIASPDEDGTGDGDQEGDPK